MGIYFNPDNGISYMSDSTTGEIEAVGKWKKLNPDIQKVVILINKGESSQMETANLLQEHLAELQMQLLHIIEIDSSVNNGLDAVVEALNSKSDGYIILARAEDYVKFVSEMYNAVYAWKRCLEELELSPETINLKEEKQLIADWFYNSSVQEGIQGDYQWIEGNKLTSVYYFRINDEGIPKWVDTRE